MLRPESERGGLILEALVGLSLLAIAMIGMTYTVAWLSRQEIQSDQRIFAEQQAQQSVLLASASVQPQPVEVDGVTVATVSVYRQGEAWYATRP